MSTQQVKKFWQAFSRPQVFIFILIGSGVIFLTFLTKDNAIEITISGFASVFIGIGVNNFTSDQTRHKDELAIKRKVAHALRMVTLVEEKIGNMYNGHETAHEQMIKDHRELTQMISLLRVLLKDEERLP